MSDAIQRDVREALTQSDDLSRRAHDARLGPMAQRLDALRTALRSIDEAIGGGRSLRGTPILAEVRRLADDLTTLEAQIPEDLRVRYGELLELARSLPIDLEGWLRSLGESRQLPSRPLFDALPLARVVPQDVHALTDYLHAVGCVSTAFIADSTEAKVAGATLGVAIGTVSALTDYRLSAAKVIPIEAHEALDYVWGATAIAAPFVLGYARKDPLAAAMHCLFGAGTILTSLFTDYRAARGVGR